MTLNNMCSWAQDFQLRLGIIAWWTVYYPGFDVRTSAWTLKHSNHPSHHQNIGWGRGVVTAEACKGRPPAGLCSSKVMVRGGSRTQFHSSTSPIWVKGNIPSKRTDGCSWVIIDLNILGQRCSMMTWCGYLTVRHLELLKTDIYNNFRRNISVWSVWCTRFRFRSLWLMGLMSAMGIGPEQPWNTTRVMGKPGAHWFLKRLANVSVWAKWGVTRSV